MERHWRYDDEPDLAALEQLYRLDKNSPEPAQGPGFNQYVTTIDGLTVRIKEDYAWVEVLVEGRLPLQRLKALQDTTRALMERLEVAPCVVECPACPDSTT